MTRLRTALLLAVVAPLATAAADEPAPKGDLARFQGTWKTTVGPDKDITIRLTFRGTATTLAMTRPDGTVVSSTGEIKLDEAARPHKTIDWRKFTGRDGEAVNDNLGIYEIEGDTLRVCSGGPGNPRPTEFAAGEGGPPHLVVLKREAGAAKKDAEPPKGDLARFQGTWKTTLGPEGNIPLTLTFKDQAVTVSGTTPDGDAFEIKGQIKLDEAARPFKAVDWIKFVGRDGNDLPDNLGIYKVEDADTIRICNGGPGRDRPTEFQAGEGRHPSLFVLKREKK